MNKFRFQFYSIRVILIVGDIQWMIGIYQVKQQSVKRRIRANLIAELRWDKLEKKMYVKTMEICRIEEILS